MIISVSQAPTQIGLDNAAGRTGEPPDARHLVNVAERANSAAALCHRGVFCHHTVSASGQPAADPLHRIRYRATFELARHLRTRCLALPPYTTAPAAGTVRAEFDGPLGARAGNMEIEVDQAEPTRLRELEVLEARPILPGGLISYELGTFVAFKAAAFAVYEAPHPQYGTFSTSGDQAGINPERFRPGQVVQDASLTTFRRFENHMWLHHRPIVAAWSAIGFTDAASRELVNVSTFTNLIDLASTARTADTPGEVIPSLYAGRGPQTSASGGDRVRCVAGVYAQGANLGASSGEVRLTSSLGSLTISGITSTARWHGVEASGTLSPTTGTVDVSTLLSNADGRDFDKVDLLGRTTTSGAGETLRVWAWFLQIAPDYTP